MSETEKLMLIVSDDENFRSEAAHFLQSLVPTTCNLLPCSFKEALQNTVPLVPAMIILEMRGQGEIILPQVEKVAAKYPFSKIVYAGRLANVEHVLQLLKMGIKDFLKLPLEQREVSALLHDLSSGTVQPVIQKMGKIVTVFSPKGGTGVSLLTANIGVTLSAQKKGKIAVCDLSPQLGDIVTYLNLAPEYTIRDLVDNTQRLDTSFLEGVMGSHYSGLSVLSSPREDQEPLNSGCLTELQEVLRLMKQTYDITLIDAGHTDYTILQLALMQSDLILLVGNPDLPSLKGLVLALTKLTKLNYAPEKIRVIINRSNSKNQLDTGDFEKKTHFQVACHLPNQYALCVQAINSGVPLADIQKSSNLVKKIEDLSEIIIAAVPVERVTAQPSRTKRLTVKIASPSAAPPNRKAGMMGWLF